MHSLHIIKIFHLIFFSDHPIQCPSIPLGQYLTPAPFSQTYLSGRYTSASPFSKRQFIHWNIYLPKGTVQITAERSPSELGRTRTHDPVSYALWSPERSKAERAAWRDTEKHTSPTVTPREHEGSGLRFKVKGELDPVSFLFKCRFYTVSTSERADV